MIDEMTTEAFPWESDEAEDWESDEALGESDEGVEDIGERTRRRHRGPQSRYRPGRGVQGIVMRGQDGRARNVRFPAKLATAEETNRGLAGQELGRRALEEKVARLEKKFGLGQKNDSAVTGLVTLGIGGALVAHGAIKAAEQTSGSKLGNWADQRSTEMATIVSVTQLATSGAKLVINGRYHRSGIGIAADIFAAAQIATFAFGSFSTPEEFQIVKDKAEADRLMAGKAKGTLFLTKDLNQVFRVEVTGGDRALRLIS